MGRRPLWTHRRTPRGCWSAAWNAEGVEYVFGIPGSGKGIFPDDHPNALGAVGFMRHDYVNFGFDEAEVLICVGYELQEFDPVKINPNGDKKIIHIHRWCPTDCPRWASRCRARSPRSSPTRRVLAATGDGAFLTNSQELETAVRERIPITVLIWEDNAYGLIEWKMDLEMGRASHIGFGNPDFVKYAESFGAQGHRITSADELLPTLCKALDADTVSVIAVPVDYSENLRLTSKLGDLTGPF